MHLDLLQMLPKQAITDIEDVAAKFSSYPSMLWPLWLRNVDTNKTSVNILQAASQLLSSYDCVTATLRFGMYCSRYYPYHGNVLSDEVAIHYLRLAFKTLLHQPSSVLTWLRKAEGFEFSKENRECFWIQACAVYAHHEYDLNPNSSNPEIEFAFKFLLNHAG